MTRPLIPCALLAAVFPLAVANGQLAGQFADTARLRTERAVERQRKALTTMAGSIATQQRAILRQLRAPHADSFFALEPVVDLVPGPAAATCEALPPAEIDSLVNAAAERTSVAPELIRSVMWQESRFRPCAISSKGAMGLMQLIPATALDLGVKDALDPQANVLGGARLLRQLMERYGGDLSLTLSAYNAGSRRVDATSGVPMIPETIDYVSRILSRLSSLDDQSARDSAPDISLRLTGSDEGK